MVRGVECSLGNSLNYTQNLNLELQLANSLILNRGVEAYDLLLKGANPFKEVSEIGKLTKSAYDIAVMTRRWQFVAQILIVEIAKKNFAKVEELMSKIGENASQVIDEPGYLSENITPRSTFLAVDLKEKSELSKVFGLA